MSAFVYWYLRGRLDHQERKPWKRAAMSESEWRESGRETPDQVAYWEGFNGGVSDHMRSVAHPTYPRPHVFAELWGG